MTNAEFSKFVEALRWMVKSHGGDHKLSVIVHSSRTRLRLGVGQHPLRTITREDIDAIPGSASTKARRVYVQYMIDGTEGFPPVLPARGVRAPIVPAGRRRS